MNRTPSVEFDTVLLHLPPINLYSIKLFYRGDFEWFNAPEGHVPQTAKTASRPLVFKGSVAGMAGVCQNLLKPRIG